MEVAALIAIVLYNGKDIKYSPHMMDLDLVGLRQGRLVSSLLNLRGFALVPTHIGANRAVVISRICTQLEWRIVEVLESYSGQA